MAFGAGWMPPMICGKCGTKSAGGAVFTVLPTMEVFCFKCAPKDEPPAPCPLCEGSGEDPAKTHGSEHR